MPTVQLKTGIKMYYQETGQGEPLILLSGACADHTSWMLQVPVLSREFRTISVDNRGIGQSDWKENLSDYSVPIMAMDIAALLDELKIDTFHLMGQSLGSAIAQELAIQYPHRVRSLILIVTWGKSDARIKQISHTMSLLIEKISIQEFFHYTYKLAFSTAVQEAQPGLIGELYKNMFLENKYPPRVEGILGQWNAVYHHDTLERLSLIKAPTLICAGEADVLIPQYYSKKVASYIPGAQYNLFRGEISSHLLHIEIAPLLNKCVLDFIHSNK